MLPYIYFKLTKLFRVKSAILSIIIVGFIFVIIQSIFLQQSSEPLSSIMLKHRKNFTQILNLENSFVSHETSSIQLETFNSSEANEFQQRFNNYHTNNRKQISNIQNATIATIKLLLNELANITSTDDNLNLAAETQVTCNIPTVETWPKGVKYKEWGNPECGGPDPIFISKGRLYFDQHNFHCSAILFGNIGINL